MVNELWKESSAAQILLEEGEAKGRVEGRAEEARKIARAVLTRRFGPPAEEVLAAIDAADEATLLEIIENMSSGESLEQVRTRLGV